MRELVAQPGVGAYLMPGTPLDSDGIVRCLRPASASGHDDPGVTVTQ
jgi:hypothetical protein